MSSKPNSDSEKGRRYVVVARRYRPRSFDQLIGQDQVSQALLNAVNTGRVGHAYLFTGARGVGKTSTARIFAKALNCPQANETGADGACTCDICQGIDSGDDIDVLEIDGASNRGIDEIRQLRANVSIRPSRAQYKIYIIDEVHMLTSPAFNALLKTLEEPPGHVKFIFCTTDPEKIPVTVLSRCQRFDFPPISSDAILSRLTEIVEAEQRTAEEAALVLLARRAGGSMRDSQSLLEQLLAFAPEMITEQDVHTMLGTAPGGRVRELSLALMKRDCAQALTQLDEAVSQGVEVSQLADQLLGYLRDVMAAAVGCPIELLVYSPGTSPAELIDQATQWGLETVLAAAQIMDQTIVRMRQSAHSRTLLEIAVVRLCQLDRLGDLAKLIDRIDTGLPPQPTPSISPPSTSSTTGTIAPTAPVPAADTANQVAADKNKKKRKKTGEEAVTTPKSAVSNEGESEKAKILSDADARGLWSQILSSIEDMTAEYASGASSVAISAPNCLVVTFPLGYTLHKDSCERPERRAKIEQAAREIAGGYVGFEFRVDSAREAPKRPKSTAASRVQALREVEKHPFVREVMEMFDAEVTRLAPPRHK
ncbi:MAG: DNA polymerase III subunit gamma/tau [Pirellulaceae bacterium]